MDRPGLKDYKLADMEGLVISVRDGEDIPCYLSLPPSQVLSLLSLRGGVSGVAVVGVIPGQARHHSSCLPVETSLRMCGGDEAAQHAASERHCAAFSVSTMVSTGLLAARACAVCVMSMGSAQLMHDCQPICWRSAAKLPLCCLPGFTCCLLVCGRTWQGSAHSCRIQQTSGIGACRSGRTGRSCPRCCWCMGARGREVRSI